MRSTFIHIKGSSRQQVEEALDSYSSEGLYIGFYEDHRSEYEPEDERQLRERLGIFPPDVTVMADISGKIVGYDESLELAQFLLNQFSGLVQDDGDGLWTLDELLRDLPSHGGCFMEDSRRHSDLPIPSGEQTAGDRRPSL